MMYNEIPINKNNVVHTGAKIQFGGLNVGVFKEAYQVGIEGEVKKEPIIPANWQITIEIMSLIMFFIFIGFF